MNIIILIFLIIILFSLKKKKYFFEKFTNYNNFEYSDELSIKDIKNLKKSQNIMTDMFKKFDIICKKHNIKYWCLGGTLIGVVRHKGWIPWDGDIDLGILKEEYDKLKVILPKELPNYMWLQDKDNDKYFNSNICKIRHLNSCYIEYTNNGNTQNHNGLQIDLFIFSNKNKVIKGKYPVCGNPDKNKRPCGDIFPLKKGIFEGFNVYIPNKTKQICQQLWGGYSPIMLPKDKRIPHEGNMDPDNTCSFHNKKYPELII